MCLLEVVVIRLDNAYLECAKLSCHDWLAKQPKMPQPLRCGKPKMYAYDRSHAKDDVDCFQHKPRGENHEWLRSESLIDFF